jgi:hypothetical protein
MSVYFYKICGFRRGMDENLALLGCYPFCLLFTGDTEQPISIFEGQLLQEEPQDVDKFVIIYGIVGSYWYWGGGWKVASEVTSA